MISTVVLAGRASRQPAEKNPSVPVKDDSALQLVLENVLAADVDEVICVANDFAAARQEIKLADRRLIWHLNTSVAQGQSDAVIAGLWASHPESDGVLLVAVEPPLVRKQLINALIDRFAKSPASIIAAGTRDQPPNPILFRRDLYPELLKLTRDDRGGSLLQKHFERTAFVEWQEEEILPGNDQRQTQARLRVPV